MRLQYNPEDFNSWLRYYASQAEQTGYGFKGNPYQRGGGLGNFFRSLFRMAIPAIRSVAAHVGQQAITSGSDIAQDVLKGKPLSEALEQHGKEGVAKLMESASNALRKQTGRGLGVRPKSIKATLVKQDIFNKKKKRKNVPRRRNISS